MMILPLYVISISESVEIYMSFILYKKGFFFIKKRVRAWVVDNLHLDKQSNNNLLDLFILYNTKINPLFKILYVHFCFSDLNYPVIRKKRL
jgi:uncharacterized pyridoxamine 5'-phosphate oxidase family protein